MLRPTETEAKVAAMVEPRLTAMGYELVRVQLAGAEVGLTLQIMAERLDGKGMNVDDCAAISRMASDLLDVEDPIEGEYHLEVSSPGIDRPLARKKDFVNFAGFDARIETSAPVDGQKKFRGRLKGLVGEGDEDAVCLDMDGKDVKIPLDAVVKAKLVLTDELIKASQGKC